jgi:hypothetical protein
MGDNNFLFLISFSSMWTDQLTDRERRDCSGRGRDADASEWRRGSAARPL